jgi:hypothetical protein
MALRTISQNALIELDRVAVLDLTAERMASSPPPFAELLERPRIDPLGAIILWPMASAGLDSLITLIVWELLS